MNKRGTGPIGFIILEIFFVINWALWLGTFINSTMQTIISTNSLTGLEAFLFANMNLWIFIILVIGNVAFFTFAASRQ